MLTQAHARIASTRIPYILHINNLLYRMCDGIYSYSDKCTYVPCVVVGSVVMGDQTSPLPECLLFCFRYFKWSSYNLRPSSTLLTNIT